LSVPAPRKILMLRNCPGIGGLKSAVELLDPATDVEVLVHGGHSDLGLDGNDWINEAADACPDAVLLCLHSDPDHSPGNNPWGGAGDWFLTRWTEALQASPALSALPRILLHLSAEQTAVDPTQFYRVLSHDCHHREVLRALREAIQHAAAPAAR
jgi:hypothetical protein